MRRTECYLKGLGSAVLLLIGAAAVARAADAQAVPSKFTHPQRGQITRYVTLPGTVRAYQEATLYAKVAGYVKTIAVDKGDAVKAGQVLAEIETPELAADLARYEAEVARCEAALAQAKAEEARAKAELDVAGLDLNRLSAAHKKAPDLVVIQTVDDAKARQAKAKAEREVAQARQKVAQAERAVAEANLKRIRTFLDYGRITAPFSGVVTARHVDPGAFIPAATSGSPTQTPALVTLMDFSKVRVQVPVPELEVPRVAKDQPVRVNIEELPGKTVEGKVSRFAYALDEATKTMLVEAEIPNSNLELRPGMYATVKVGVETHSNAWVIPVEALAAEKSGASVYLFVDGKAKKTPVKAGFNDGARVEIISGVAADDRVLVFGKTPPADGQAVSATEAK